MKTCPHDDLSHTLRTTLDESLGASSRCRNVQRPQSGAYSSFRNDCRRGHSAFEHQRVGPAQRAPSGLETPESRPSFDVSRGCWTLQQLPNPGQVIPERDTLPRFMVTAKQWRVLLHVPSSQSVELIRVLSTFHTMGSATAGPLPLDRQLRVPSPFRQRWAGVWRKINTVDALIEGTLVGAVDFPEIGIFSGAS